MTRQTSLVFWLFISIVLLSGCSSLDFVDSGKTTFKISAGIQSDLEVKIHSTRDFYFWGRSPKNFVIDLDDHATELGLEHPSAVMISQTIGWKSFLYTIVTFGLYCPVDYQISLFTNKAL